MKKVLALSFFVFLVTFTSIVLTNFGYVQEGEYKKEFNKSYFPTTGLLKIDDIKENAVIVSVRGKKMQVEMGEVKTINRHTKIYSGNVKLIEVKDNTALLLLDIKRTGYFYIAHVLIFLLSLIVSILIGIIYKKGREKQMIEIDYSKSTVKQIGDLGFELTSISGQMNGQEFIITISESPTSKNNSAKVIKGNLKETEITSILREFNQALCKQIS